MSRRSRSRDDSAEVNVTPLLDIVFIMLIFFIVTATFVFEDGIAPTLPENNEDTPDSIPPPTRLLTVQEDGFVQVDSTRVILPGSVKSVIEEFFATNPEDGVVIVSAHPRSESGITMNVLDQARQAAEPAQQRRITLALQSEEKPG